MIYPPASGQAADQASAEQTAAPLAAGDLATELERARQRLAFYESFDSLIRDNVLRSGELLRQVVAEREQTDQKLLAMQTELDRRLAEQRTTLADIGQGLSGLQASLGSLSERVTASLAALPDSASVATIADETVRAPLGDESDGRPATLSDEARAEQAEAVAASEPVPIPVLAAPGTDHDTAAVGTIAAVTQPIEGETPPRPLVLPDEARSTDNAVSDATSPARRKIDLIVHGVPKAATALSLQRHLQELSGVEAVEVREYVSGVLRFQIVATELGPDDFRRWEGGDGLETVTVRDNVLELKLAAAEGY